MNLREIFENKTDAKQMAEQVLQNSGNNPVLAFKNTFAYMQEVADSPEKFAAVFSTMRELYKNIPMQNVSEQVEAASSVLDFANNYKGDNREAIGQNILEFTDSLDENIKQHARIKDDFEALKLSGNKKPVSPIKIELGQVKKVDNTKSRAFLEAAKEVADKMQNINESLSDGINTKLSPEVDNNARQPVTEPGLAMAEKARVTVDPILEAAIPAKPLSQATVQQSVNDKGSNISEQASATPSASQVRAETNAEEAERVIRESGKSIADRKAALEEEVKNNQAKNANKINAEQEIRELRAAAGEEPLSLAQRRDTLQKAFENQPENTNKRNAGEEITQAYEEAGAERKSIAQLAKEQEERSNGSNPTSQEAVINNNVNEAEQLARQRNLNVAETEEFSEVDNRPLPPTPEQAAQQQQADQQRRIVPNKPLPPTPEQAVQDQQPGSNQVDKIDQAQEQDTQNQDAKAHEKNDRKPKKRGLLERFGDALKDEFTPSNKTMMMIWAALLVAAMLFFPGAILPLVIFGAAAAGAVAANKTAKVFNSPVGHSIAKAVSAPMGMLSDLVNGVLKGTAALGAIVATPFTDKTLAENVKAATGVLPELGSFTKAALGGGVSSSSNPAATQKVSTANPKTTDTTEVKQNDVKGQESKREDKEAVIGAVDAKGSADRSVDRKTASKEDEKKEQADIVERNKNVILGNHRESHQQPTPPPVPPRPTQAEIEMAKVSSSTAAGQEQGQQPTPQPAPAPSRVDHNSQGKGLDNQSKQDVESTIERLSGRLNSSSPSIPTPQANSHQATEAWRKTQPTSKGAREF